jgi:hypothetical protein
MQFVCFCGKMDGIGMNGVVDQNGDADAHDGNDSIAKRDKYAEQTQAGPFC